ncbi:hypothetical protein V1517DRAFT_33675 [Lipomyces orientalis]|uniref:Uncharacterized protein n=1 Tax=Lipomyces orientalis TaxID=1233043 RepID=A0ACC3TEL2_9ASCO
MIINMTIKSRIQVACEWHRLLREVISQWLRSNTGSDRWLRVASPLSRNYLFLRGFTGHVDCYMSCSAYIIGIEVFAFDQRGAGQTSPEKRDWGLTDEEMTFLDQEIIMRKVGPDVVDDKS